MSPALRGCAWRPCRLADWAVDAARFCSMFCCSKPPSHDDSRHGGDATEVTQAQIMARYNIAEGDTRVITRRCGGPPPD